MATPQSSGLYVENCDLLTCRTIGLLIESTWGDHAYVGLAGVEVLLGNHCAVAAVDDKMVFAQPRDLSELGRFDDPRVVGNLFNGYNDTCDDRHMWLVPFTAGAEHVLRVDLGVPSPVAGLRVWNYNKSSEDVLRGARLVTVTADGRPVGRCVLRPAPGCDGVEYAQTIFIRDVLTPSPQRCPGLALRPPGEGSGSGYGHGVGSASMSLLQYVKPTVRQDFEVPLLPSGLLWRFTLHGNWHDSYYVGLDAMEFYDAAGNLLDLVACGATVTAVPHSLADLEPFDYAGRTAAAGAGAGAGSTDPRTPDKLFSARKSTGNDNVSSAWLAPLSRSMTPSERVNGTLRVLQKQAAKAAAAARRRGAKASPVPPLASVRLEDLHLPRENTLFVLFPYPVAVSLLRIYNYSKTPARGVKELAITVDGRDLYMGTLESSDRENRALGGGQSIVFTADPKVRAGCQLSRASNRLAPSSDSLSPHPPPRLYRAVPCRAPGVSPGGDARERPRHVLRRRGMRRAVHRRKEGHDSVPVHVYGESKRRRGQRRRGQAAENVNASLRKKNNLLGFY